MAKPNAQCLAYSVCVTQLNLLYMLENMFCCTQQLASYYVRHYYMSSVDWKAAITAYMHTWCMLHDVRTFVHTWSQSCYSHFITLISFIPLVVSAICCWCFKIWLLFLRCSTKATITPRTIVMVKWRAAIAANRPTAVCSNIQHSVAKSLASNCITQTVNIYT